MSEYRIQFLGAAGQVTGSRTLLSFDGHTVLVDCGLFQGPKSEREKNWAPLGPNVADLEAVFLTHAHLDHSGYLPRLYRNGFRGPIHASAGTCDLAQILLLDAAKLQEEDAQYANRTGHSHHKPALPLYTTEDVEGVLKLLKPHSRNEWLRVGSNLGVRFINSGHIIGSSFVQFSLGGGNQPALVTFSGDLGHGRSKILRSPESILETDVLILESTYGNRRHSTRDTLDDLADVVKRTMERGGVLVIPAFAVGRAQEVIYLLRILEDENRIPSVPVILDSPMASQATDIFLRHTEDHVLPYAFADGAFYPKQFQTTESQEESMLACMQDGPLIVISASGMLTGGRVLHHLKKRLPDARNTLLFVGYQAEGSKGRYLQDHGRQDGVIRIHHQEVSVEAEIAYIESLSAHGDYEDILSWLRRFQTPPKQVILNHGTPESAEALAEKIRTQLKWPKVDALTQKNTFRYQT